jgi:hypothetical protein
MSKKKINIDFQVIDTRDPRVLMLADSSEWGQIEGQPAIIEIITPGESEPIVLNWDKKKINIFNSNNLLLTCPTGDCEPADLIDLPDGVYEITLKGSPDTFNKTRKYLKTNLAQLELDKIYITLNLNCPETDTNILKTIQKIELLIKAAESNVRHDNMCEAQELFFKAQEMIEDIKGCSLCAGVAV